MPVLLKYEDDYADEFDVYGFMLMTDEEWNKFEKVIDCMEDFPQEFYFGTNEQIIYENKENVKRAFKPIRISLEDAKVIKKLFGNQYNDDVNFGFIPYDQIRESISNEAFDRSGPEEKV
jgi:hypothetical protein